MHEPERPAGPADLADLAVLVGRAQSGHAASLDALLRRLQEPLYRHVREIVRDDHVAEEVLQETLLTIARKLAWLRDPRWLRAWAYRIATRHAVRRAGAERRWQQALREEALAPLPAPAEPPPFEAELIAEVPALLATLSPAAAAVVRLRYLEQLSLAEIAEALEIPDGTVRSRLAFGLATLRRELAARQERERT